MDRQTLLQVLDRRWSPVLGAAGFRRRGGIWLREVAGPRSGAAHPQGIAQLIEVLVNQPGDAFTVNLGVLWRALPPRPDRPLPRGKARLADCHVRQRLGVVWFAHDFWWPAGSPRLVEQGAAEALPALRKYGLPWLERFSQADECLRTALGARHYCDELGVLVGKPGWLFLTACLLALAGRSAEAVAMATRLADVAPDLGARALAYATAAGAAQP